MRNIKGICAALLTLAVCVLSLASCAEGENLPGKTESVTDTERTEQTSEIKESRDTTDLHTVSEKGERNGFSVCIDAGHQQKGIPEKEPNGPGSDVMKAKLSSGTRGVVTGIPEYVLTLEVSLLLKEELNARGYEVIMIRETHDCPKSNAERALIANESGADIFVRIHANGSSNSSVSGALTCAPTDANEFLSKELVAESRRLSRNVVDKLCESAGARNRGIYNTDTMTGINWCKIPVTIVEMGYMSNPEEDRLMATDEYRERIACGIADGIDLFFGIVK